MAKAFFARVFLICGVVLTIAACSGGGGNSGPPPASREQVQAIAPAPIDPQTGRELAGGQTLVADSGSILPLSVLQPRASSGLTTMAISTCASTAACTGGTNSSTGPGVAGVSAQGKGVTGTTTYASTTSANGQFGVYGQDSSASGAFDIGVYGISVNGIGVSGKSTSNYGMRATSTNNAGLFATSPYNMGVYATGGTRGVYGAGPIGVYGNGSSRGVYGNGASSSAIAVYGTNPSYIGVYGTGLYGLYGIGTSYGAVVSSSSGIGGYFTSSTNAAGYFSSSSGRGVQTYSSSATSMYAGAGTGYAIEGHTGGSVGAYITNTNGNGADITGTYLGVVARGPTNGFPLVVTDASGNNLFYVNGAGNVYYTGGIFKVASVIGSKTMALGSQPARLTIENTGTAQLVNGRAVVPIDSALARNIDTGRPYQVFLTPGGDTRGLYVASKSATQFVVREVQSGRGTFSFDYHIYAIALNRTTEQTIPVQPNARPLRFSPPAQVHPVEVRPQPQN